MRSALDRVLGSLFGTRAAGLYILLFAAAIGVGTFIENDFGTSSAQHVVYRSTWFSVLLILFCITIVVNIFRYRMVEQRKWALLTFHAAMVVILIGAGITRYFGFEGVMHIREGGDSNIILSSETFLRFEAAKGDRTFRFDEPVLFSSLGNNDWHASYRIGGDLVEVAMKEFIPNPVEVLEDSPAGRPTLKVVFAGMNGREEYFISNGETRRIRDVLFNFNETPRPGAVNITYRDNALWMSAEATMVRTVMATQTTDTLPPSAEPYPLALRAMYRLGPSGFVFGDFNPSGMVHLESKDVKVKNESMVALRLEVKVNGDPHEVLVVGQKGQDGRPAIVHTEALDLAVAYGAKEITLPFHVHLHDFIMERYPGTNSAASYMSVVQLVDPREGIDEERRIFMNNILDHDGYRFFQSSFDRDELGTYLSVNHDFWGTWVSYIGYALLTLGMILTLFSKRSRFQHLSRKIAESRAAPVAAVFTALLLAPTLVHAQRVIDQESSAHVVDAGFADRFSRLVVQDLNGRMKPVHTLSREVLRKVARRERIEGLNADQVLLGMFLNARDWFSVPMIKVGEHRTIREKLGVNTAFAAYDQFFGEDGAYLLRDEVRAAVAMQPADRTMYEKDLLKVDERVNIMNMVFSGHLLKLVPVAGDANNTWSSASTGHDEEHVHDAVAERFFAAFVPALQEAVASGDYSLPSKLITELDAYQHEQGAAVMPTTSQVSMEILLNRLDVFDRLALLYALLGLGFLCLLFLNVLKPSLKTVKAARALNILLLLGFLMHTVGLGIRWYVSGRAPWSNGYESMIYIAWTTVLAGVLFGRRSLGGAAATMMLSATVLLVAMLSYLDPEITPLVPVLKSYWLTIHVSMEAGSYGFLALGAVIGLINLMLMVLLTERREKRVHRLVKELTMISEMTLIGGLFMISIGTYLGGVWANESWGRYWGWDAKETWALVTILVYAFILHMRLIPGLKGLYAYNLASLFGMASVIMTYYGVNYYLSGLHSYAAGDPVPVPQWVYITAATFVVIGALAYWRKRKFKLIT
ncbi:MAG: cytochrome c biogenesis protein CcsA [Flavobacteriales bacterium]|nr:cytochrome c biogenesis protein CcsA [Flavobacteriales bacterium]